MVALVVNSEGKPRIVGQISRSLDGKRIWRIWNCSATYDAVSNTWSAVADKGSRRVITSETEIKTYSRRWIMLAHLSDGDTSPLSPPFFGDIGE